MGSGAAHVAGDLDAAERLLARAEHQSRQCGARPHVARALYDRSLLLADRPTNVKGTAEEAMAQARHIAAEIGLVLGDLTPTAATPSMP